HRRPCLLGWLSLLRVLCLLYRRPCLLGWLSLLRVLCLRLPVVRVPRVARVVVPVGRSLPLRRLHRQPPGSSPLPPLLPLPLRLRVSPRQAPCPSSRRLLRPHLRQVARVQ
ncbi:hypothetical protein, partial [Mycolicibacterium doricum]|uniref:hypothetical protein n=1 Tax=Mycolicibacterium doricum TaxID=126673 RepID=UPI001F427640